MMKERKTVVVDIDGVIADEAYPGEIYSDEGKWAYEKCLVLRRGKQLLQILKNAGYKVILHTARNSERDAAKTIEWLLRHELNELVDQVVFDKPLASLYIDDKGYRWPRFTSGTDDEVCSVLELLNEKKNDV